MNDLYEYDVALSFAGEDRAYVRAVADKLSSSGVKVFFDEYEQVYMWGKDLYEHLHEVYTSKAKYCVAFISNAYAKKIWTTLERRSAQERALRESNEYLLPARFDSTQLPGLSSTVGYIDLTKLGPEEFAQIIIEKLNQSHSPSITQTPVNYNLPKKPAQPFNPYDEANRFISFLQARLQERANALQNAGASLSVFQRADKTCVRVVRSGQAVFSLDIWTGGIAGDKGISFYGVDGEIRIQSDASNGWAELIWDNGREEVALKVTDLSLLGHLSSSGETMTFDEFTERIWNRIVAALDRA